MTQKEVNRFAEVCGLLKSLTDEYTKLQGKLLKEFEQGAVCPTGGPYVLQVIEQDKADLKWKSVAEDFAKRLFSISWRSELRKLKATAPRKIVKFLKSSPNPNWTKKAA